MDKPAESFTLLGRPPLEEEWPLQAGSNLVVDHYYEASRTTETQQKEEVAESRHLIHQVLCHVGHIREQSGR